MKPVGVILDFDKGTVTYVTPDQAVKAAAPSKKQAACVSGRTPPADEPKK
jgi:hypothetical protein